MAGTVRKINWTTRKGEAKSAWVADYFDQRRKRHTRNFTTKRAAEAWLLQVRSDVRDGVHTAVAGSIMVAEAGQRWLDRGAALGLERSTLQTYEIRLRRHIVPAIGNIRLAQLTTPDVEHFRDELLLKLPREYARSVVRTLKGILNNAMRCGEVARNVALPTIVPTSQRDVKILEIGRDVPSKPEMQAILAAAPERWRTMLLTAAFTGLRSSELRGLTWAEIDLTAKVLRVRQRADHWGTMGPPKSKAGKREIPLMPIVLSALREWRVAYPFGPDGIVFCHMQRTYAEGRIVGHATLWWLFREAQHRAGVVDATGRPKYRFHTLRHFFTSIGIEAGFSPKRLQALLGHASFEMTYDRYGHLFPNPEDDQARFIAMERSVFGSK